jgi:hypothetical protein
LYNSTTDMRSRQWTKTSGLTQVSFCATLAVAAGGWRLATADRCASVAWAGFALHGICCGGATVSTALQWPDAGR